VVPVSLLNADEIGEGLFPVGLPVIWPGAVEAGVDKDGEGVESLHTRGINRKLAYIVAKVESPWLRQQRNWIVVAAGEIEWGRFRDVRFLFLRLS
jgi:hypothetical protein